MSNVRGPTSALTEFLREKNIHIPNTNRYRRREDPQTIEEAAATADAIADEVLQEAQASAAAGPSSSTSSPATRASKRRSDDAKVKDEPKRKKSKIGASMNFDEEDDDDDSNSDSDLSAEGDEGGEATMATAGDEEVDKWQRIAMGQAGQISQRLLTSGSLDHCPGCEKRFCITQYTTQTPSGGLCHKCAPLYNQATAQGAGTARSATGKQKQGSKAAAPNGKLAGTTGKKPVQRKKTTMQKPQDKKVLPTLQGMCIDIISEYIEDVEALGGIGRQSIDTLSKSICKSRRLNSQTVQLFLEPAIDSLSLYDCSKLDTEALQSIGTFSRHIKDLNLQLCGQLDNDAVDSWSRNLKDLRRLELYGPYLVRVDAWQRFFESVGPRLESFKVRESARFNLSCVEAMVRHCPNIAELGLAQIGPLDGACLKALQSLEELTYLDVSDPGVSAPGVPPKSLEDDEVIELLSHVGTSLTHLNIGGNADLTDRVVLEGILPYCPSLRELNIAHCEKIAGDAIAILFDSLNARGCPPLEKVSLERCRGMTDEGLRALIQHSGPKLAELNLNACAKLTKPALKLIAGDWSDWSQREAEAREASNDLGPAPIDPEVMQPGGGIAGCSALERLDVGFVRSTDDDGLTTIMDGNKRLQEIKVFGCQRISDLITGTATCKILGLERVPLIAKNVVETF